MPETQSLPVNWAALLGAGRGPRTLESSWVRAPSWGRQQRLSSPRGSGEVRAPRQRRRWGTQAPCGRLRAKPALQTQRKEPLVFTQRSLLHSSPRWFSSRHSSMSGGGGDRCIFTGTPEYGVRSPLSLHTSLWPRPHPAPGSPTQRAREASSWKPPGHSHTAPPGRGTQRPLTQRHSSESSSELSSSAQAGRMSTLTSTSTTCSPTGTPADHHHALPSCYTHLEGASPAAGDSRPRKNCSHSATSGTGTLGGTGAVSVRDAPSSGPNRSGGGRRFGSPELRGGQGRHCAPQPRPWRQQQSSKVRVGPARGPAHMPSSPRWAQHTSRRSGARSVEGDPASARRPKAGVGGNRLPRSHPPSQGPRPRGSTQRTGPSDWPRTTLALTGWALRELAIAAGGPGHPGRAALAAVGARQVDAATRAAGCRVLALVYVYG